MRAQPAFDKDEVNLLADAEDQFGRIAAIADTQREYLQCVIEFD